MAFTVVLLVCLIVAPFMAHLRQWKPASLFAAAASVYVVFSGIGLVNPQIMLGSHQKSGTVMYDSLYFLYYGYSLLFRGLIMAFFGALIWFQTHIGAMLYPRMTKTLFWVFHLSLIVLGTFSFVYTHYFPAPRRQIDYSDFIGAPNSVSNGALFLAGVTGLGLIGLLVLSAVIKRRTV